ncbi:EthD domain-containing protein [Pseudomonas citronellolis]|uniref:EthD domain-containing protein n=1 Tax=Pseudomonas citronellolis TaxID=53408 RepID=UPI0021C22A63|nr:EthD domain-containing protein [Pseudomonas citronellolis]UXJ50260.1 EthD domain-containing protein [Pseudomonas citronellolis]
MKLITTLKWHTIGTPTLPRTLLWCLPEGCRISQSLEHQTIGYDLLLEQDADSPQALDVLYRQFSSQATLTSYLVEEHVEKDSPNMSSGTGQHGRKLITCWQARADLTLDQARRHWDEHVPMANRIHIGCRRYVRNWVRALARASGDFPPIYTGFTFQYYASAQDLAERMFDSPESACVIQRDVEEFIDTFEVQVCTERLLETPLDLKVKGP